MIDVLSPEPTQTFGAPAERPRKIFAIIGTREPDENQAECAKHLAFAFAVLGRHTVRTGAADGIDQRAMEGTNGTNLQVFLPWSSYNRDIIPATARVVVYNPGLHQIWADSVRTHHPAWNRLSRSAFALHARNYGIICGESEDRVSAVIAFPDANGGGGTGQGLRIARALKIPVIEGRRGKIDDYARFIGKTLQALGLADPDLRTTISGKTGR